MQKRKVVTSSWRAVASFLAILAIACSGAESPETPVTQTTAPGSASASASGPQAEVTTPPVALQPVDEVVFIHRLVRSRIRLRSNSAKAPKTWKIKFPPEVEVSIDSWILQNPGRMFP